MGNSIRKIILVLVLLIIGVSCACGAVTVTTSCGNGGNVVGASTTFNAPIDAAIRNTGVLSFVGNVGLSNTMSGSGDLTDRRWVSNTAGSYAEEGVTIKNAESYAYTYTLSPEGGAGWSASQYPTVSAGESLDVTNAKLINAYALSRNAKGYNAYVSTKVSDAKNKASLLGYSNNAQANENGVTATQQADSIIGSGSFSVVAKDKRGKEAKSIADFIGSYSIEQFASIDETSANSAQSLSGIGLFEDAKTYAKDGKGKEAVSKESGTFFKGNMILNQLEASVDASSAHATQETEFEYGSYPNFVNCHYDIFGTFSTSTKDGSGKVTTATQKVSHGEYYQSSLESSLTASGASSSLSAVMIGVGVDSVSAKDMSGKKAESKTSYVGVFSDGQYASIDESAAQSAQSLTGVGFFKGATTSARDGKGKEAIADEFGGHTGNIITNRLGASVDAASSYASMQNEFEYMPIGYHTFIYDQTIEVIFSTSTKDGNGKVTTAKQKISHGEHSMNLLESTLTASGASSSLSSKLIGVGVDSVSAKDMSGKKAESKSSYVGVISDEQYASIDESAAQSSQSLRGVGFFAGATTSVKDGKGKEAIADEFGKFSGNLFKNLLGASVDASSSHATLQAQFEYMPVSYGAGTYDTSYLTFNSLAKTKTKSNFVKEERKGVLTPYVINQDVSAL